MFNPFAKRSQQFESLLSKEAAGQELSPRDKIKDANLAVWFARAEKATRFCNLCSWPLEDGISQETRCGICIQMESLLWGRTYWITVRVEERMRRRWRQDNE